MPPQQPLPDAARSRTKEGGRRRRGGTCWPRPLAVLLVVWPLGRARVPAQCWGIGGRRRRQLTECSGRAFQVSLAGGREVGASAGLSTRTGAARPACLCPSPTSASSLLPPLTCRVGSALGDLRDGETTLLSGSCVCWGCCMVKAVGRSREAWGLGIPRSPGSWKAHPAVGTATTKMSVLFTQSTRRTQRVQAGRAGL